MCVCACVCVYARVSVFLCVHACACVYLCVSVSGCVFLPPFSLSNTWFPPYSPTDVSVDASTRKPEVDDKSAADRQLGGGNPRRVSNRLEEDPVWADFPAALPPLVLDSMPPILASRWMREKGGGSVEIRKKNWMFLPFCLLFFQRFEGDSFSVQLYFLTPSFILQTKDIFFEITVTNVPGNDFNWKKKIKWS